MWFADKRTKNMDQVSVLFQISDNSYIMPRKILILLIIFSTSSSFLLKKSGIAVNEMILKIWCEDKFERDPTAIIHYDQSLKYDIFKFKIFIERCLTSNDNEYYSRELWIRFMQIFWEMAKLKIIITMFNCRILKEILLNKSHILCFCESSDIFINGMTTSDDNMIFIRGEDSFDIENWVVMKYTMIINKPIIRTTQSLNLKISLKDAFAKNKYTRSLEDFSSRNHIILKRTLNQETGLVNLENTNVNHTQGGNKQSIKHNISKGSTFNSRLDTTNYSSYNEKEIEEGTFNRNINQYVLTKINLTSSMNDSYYESNQSTVTSFNRNVNQDFNTRTEYNNIQNNTNDKGNQVKDAQFNQYTNQDATTMIELENPKINRNNKEYKIIDALFSKNINKDLLADHELGNIKSNNKGYNITDASFIKNKNTNLSTKTDLVNTKSNRNYYGGKITEIIFSKNNNNYLPKKFEFESTKHNRNDTSYKVTEALFNNINNQDLSTRLELENTQKNRNYNGDKITELFFSSNSNNDLATKAEFEVNKCNTNCSEDKIIKNVNKDLQRKSEWRESTNNTNYYTNYRLKEMAIIENNNDISKNHNTTSDGIYSEKGQIKQVPKSRNLTEGIIRVAEPYHNDKNTYSTIQMRNEILINRNTYQDIVCHNETENERVSRGCISVNKTNYSPFSVGIIEDAYESSNDKLNFFNQSVVENRKQNVRNASSNDRLLDMSIDINGEPDNRTHSLGNRREFSKNIKDVKRESIDNEPVLSFETRTDIQGEDSDEVELNKKVGKKLDGNKMEMRKNSTKATATHVEKVFNKNGAKFFSNKDLISTNEKEKRASNEPNFSNINKMNDKKSRKLRNLIKYANNNNTKYNGNNKLEFARSHHSKKRKLERNHLNRTYRVQRNNSRNHNNYFNEIEKTINKYKVGSDSMTELSTSIESKSKKKNKHKHRSHKHSKYLSNNTKYSNLTKLKLKKEQNKGLKEMLTKLDKDSTNLKINWKDLKSLNWSEIGLNDSLRRLGLNKTGEDVINQIRTINFIPSLKNKSGPIFKTVNNETDNLMKLALMGLNPYNLTTDEKQNKTDSQNEEKYSLATVEEEIRNGSSIKKDPAAIGLKPFGGNHGYEDWKTSKEFWKIIIIPVIVTLACALILVAMVFICWKCCCLPLLRKVETENVCRCEVCHCPPRNR